MIRFGSPRWHRRTPHLFCASTLAIEDRSARRIAANIAELPDGHAAKYFSNNLRPLKLQPLNL
jgi:hypothetical protein